MSFKEVNIKEEEMEMITCKHCGEKFIHPDDETNPYKMEGRGFNYYSSRKGGNYIQCPHCMKDSRGEQIINLTPHPIHIVDADGLELRQFASAGAARLEVFSNPAGDIDGIPCTINEFGEVSGLPEFSPGTYYIVSQMIKSAYPERKDLLVPAGVVRNSDGQIVGCRSLGR
ncbi:MAG: hypothetical protein JW885_02615 [Deltaproteobacteria bacterium]|nr:hypothetical protein [Candidatus Zymogenaceae bacterium]